MPFSDLDTKALDIQYQRLSDGPALFIPASGNPFMIDHLIVDRDVQTVPSAFATFNPGEKTTLMSFRKSAIDPLVPSSNDKLVYSGTNWRITEIIRFDGAEYECAVIQDDA